MDNIDALKLECLKLATEKHSSPDPTDVVKAAEAYWQWLTRPASLPEPSSRTPSTS
jgi:hypothetical protein